MEQEVRRPDYIFEVSWEICNKVGGIHTVITSKTLTLVHEWGDKLIMIGPDTWKGEGEHPEFSEDKDLLVSLRQHAAAKGLKFKIGRWKITGNPICILVDYTPFFIRKDEIFSQLWTQYKVDSLTGGWDYIEPALFGYAAGKVIECFYHHHLTFSDKIIAQFHEWITGVGLLYLNHHVPQIATVFTTHATVVGRCIAGNGLPLYSKFDSYNAIQEARNFNVTAKHSLEKMAALHADCFTTVSEITARECEHFLEQKPDLITPNGFEDFIVPYSYLFKEKRNQARKKLVKVASKLFGYELSPNAMLVIKSGRYEFRNKGIDLFIDALGKLNKDPSQKREIVAFIFVPAHSTGPRKDLLESWEDEFRNESNTDKVLTHYLQGAEKDLILNRIKQNNLDRNTKEQKVKIVFVPVYMSGFDGIFNLHYYELLVGFDLSVFPSYYEPWGYTPLESLAFHIPTITTNLTGFGMIIKSKSDSLNKGILIIDRSDTNDEESTQEIASAIKEYSTISADEIKIATEAAFQLSKTALWKNFISYYKKAYSYALEKAEKRSDTFKHEEKVLALDEKSDLEYPKTSEPVWRKIFIQSELPDVLKPLSVLAHNLWWTWNREAYELFDMLGPEQWKLKKDPINLINELSYPQLQQLEKKPEFISKLKVVYEKFNSYLKQKLLPKPLVAYFCMEYGLTSSLKIYSGGLGILAGDYLKQASDSKLNAVAVGLLFRSGYFRQELSIHGEQLEREDIQKFTELPLSPVNDAEGNWLKIGIAFPGRTLYAKVWLAQVGRIPLYLLDTDIPENNAEDRLITDKLYGGDWENRLKQELLLGIGGVRLLNVLEMVPDVFHYNEGHSAFAILERLLLLVQEDNLSFDEAAEIVRSSSLFTTHTPVPAGHDSFSEELMRAYLSYHANLLNISWKRFMSLGKMNENSLDEKFSLSFFAARFSQEMNGVSLIHEKVTKRMFSSLWKGYADEELCISHVTNGVHYPNWTSFEWQDLYEKTFGKEFPENAADTSVWLKIKKVPDATIWEIRNTLKRSLLEEIKNRLLYQVNFQNQYNKFLSQQIAAINEKALIIGFARRFVTYKRSSLLFQDIQRLASISENCKFPVLFLFAGKAHPKDTEAQDMIQKIVDLSLRQPLLGKVLFIQNYEIDLAKYLVQGVDVWLNTPELEMEASGTSGMKAALNGVLNFSSPDGWWADADRSEVGWTFSSRVLTKGSEMRNEADAEALYDVLENEIIPLFSERNKENIPVSWIAKIKESIAALGPVYTTPRMLNEYKQKYYSKLHLRKDMLSAKHYESAKKLAAWKLKVAQNWDSIRVLSMEVYDADNKAFPLGAELNPSVVIDPGELSDKDIGVEIVFINKRKNGQDFDKIVFKKELVAEDSKTREIKFSGKIIISQSGVFEHGFRIYPKNPLLAGRLDFPLVKWF